MHNFYFDASDLNRFDVRQLDLFKPNIDVFNYNVANYFHISGAVGTMSQPAVSGRLEGALNRGATNEKKLMSYDAFQSQLTVDGISATFNMAFSGSAYSDPPGRSDIADTPGRSANPTRFIDTEYNTIRLGAGAEDVSLWESTNYGTAASGAAPYSHSAAYLLFNAGLSGNQ